MACLARLQPSTEAMPARTWTEGTSRPRNTRGRGHQAQTERCKQRWEADEPVRQNRALLVWGMPLRWALGGYHEKAKSRA